MGTYIADTEVNHRHLQFGGAHHIFVDTDTLKKLRHTAITAIIYMSEWEIDEWTINLSQSDGACLLRP